MAASAFDIELPATPETARSEASRLVLALNDRVPRSNHQVSKVFHTALQQLEKAGLEDEEWLKLVWDMRLWFIQPREVLTRQLEDGKIPDLSERFGDWANNLDYLPMAALDHFKIRLEEFTNPYMRARYADFLAMRAAVDTSTEQRKTSRELILKAIPDYLASLEILKTSTETTHIIAAIESLDSAAYLAIAKARDQLTPVVQALRQQLEAALQELSTVNDQTISKSRWVVESGWILLNVRCRERTAVSDADLQWWQEQAESLARHKSPHSNPFPEQVFWIQAAEAARLREQSSERLDLLHEMARSKAREARTRTQGETASFLAGASLMEEAVENFDRLLSMTPDPIVRKSLLDEQRQLKLEIREFYREGEHELNAVSIPLQISRESLEAAVKPFLEPQDLAECLKRLGSSLLPDIEEAKKSAESRAKQGGLMSFMGTSLMGDGREIRHYSSPKEKEVWELNRSLDWQIQIYNSVLLPLIWERLRSEKNLNAQTLLEYLDSWGFLEEDRRTFVQRGIEHYIADDFASALHLLVPQLEHIIRNLFERAGLPPIKSAASGNGWEFETFGALLRRIDKELPGFLPPELQLYIERTLADPTGWNLRNRIAHGLITIGECSRMQAETVLHLYLSFSLFNAFTEGGDYEPVASVD